MTEHLVRAAADGIIEKLEQGHALEPSHLLNYVAHRHTFRHTLNAYRSLFADGRIVMDGERIKLAPA